MLLCPNCGAQAAFVSIPSNSIPRLSPRLTWKCTTGKRHGSIGLRPICSLDELPADHPTPAGKRDGFWCANMHLNGQDVGLAPE